MAGRRRETRAPASFPRIARVNEVLREVVADAIERQADTDDRLRLVTVTAVDTAPDLSHATVYLSSLPPPALEALIEQRRVLQAAIGRQVRMKRTPQLSFEPDPAVAHGLRVEEILRTIRRTSDEATAPPDPVSPSDASRPSDTSRPSDVSRPSDGAVE